MLISMLVGLMAICELKVHIKVINKSSEPSISFGETSKINHSKSSAIETNYYKPKLEECKKSRNEVCGYV